VLTGKQVTGVALFPTGANPPRYACKEQLERLPEYPFHVAYESGGRDERGRAQKFTLTLTEKTRAGGRPKVVWIDETGIRRECVLAGGGQRDSVRLMSGRSLYTFLWCST
jgi:hypothetical protein